jgi:type I restriction enzyme R subunit
MKQSSSPLALEAATVQFPLVRHAVDAGWTFVPEDEALARRGGEDGIFFVDRLREALLRLNPGVVTPENIGAVIGAMEAAPPTMEGNKQLLDWLRGYRTVFVPAEKRARHVRVIDYSSPAVPRNNVFEVTVEWAFRRMWKKGNRPDVVFLINGVPVAVVECKNPRLKGAMEKALVQLRRYEKETPEMLMAPQVFNLTHLLEWFYGVTWNYERKNVFNWKQECAAGSAATRWALTDDEDGPARLAAEDSASGPPPTYGEQVRGFFDRDRFLILLREWILFYTKDDELKKTVLRQHQTRAIEKVIARCLDPRKTRGLVWHTQGSGKTFTMITAARLLLSGQLAGTTPTVLLVVDRNELEGQLAGWVERLLGEIRGAGIKVEPAYNRERLRELLTADFRGLILTMIHKFDGLPPRLANRPDIFVLIDEAHRSTGGDLGNYLMGALPAATFIGFTGTPIARTERGEGTFKTFGSQDPDGYLDKYPIAESIRDRTTLKLRHQLAPSELVLDERLLDREFLSLAETEGISDIDDLNRVLERAVNLRTFLKAPARIEKVAAFIARHFRENVQPLGYKAFVVAVDREACAAYKKALDRHLPPEWSQVVYTRNPNDVVERPLVAELQLDEAAEKSIRKEYPKAATQPQILIVTDKLLTGYDAPILYCMYLDKPMRDHVLLQAVARVNRPYEDAEGIEKPCGLVIDFVGVLRDLKKALAFDSEDYSGVIEDLNLLLPRFRELVDGPARSYLRSAVAEVKGRDAQLEKLLYQVLFQRQARDRFAELFKEVEELYEILSPDPALADYIGPYNELADLFAMMQAAYGSATSFIGDLAHKTARLVQENASAHGIDRLTRPVEFDEGALSALRNRDATDEGKVVNLSRVLQAVDAETQPHLISIAERAATVMQSLDERQASTQQALEQLQALANERQAAEVARESSGLAPAVFTVFWELRRDGYSDNRSRELALEIESAYARFPNAADNPDEKRQLKAEIYKVLLKVVSGKKMIDLADRLMGAHSPQ